MALAGSLGRLINLGESVTNLGDVNGDGVTDLAAGVLHLEGKEERLEIEEGNGQVAGRLVDGDCSRSDCPDGLDAPHAARVLALTSVAMADSFICCWDAKYTYWTARPITADPSSGRADPDPAVPVLHLGACGRLDRGGHGAGSPLPS